MERVLITGASRGIGLELARHYLERGDLVVATARNLEAVADLQALPMNSHTGMLRRPSA